jgi:adenosyl cobinamide kinase/adenosyl cobinamide phosphate guanylyltransferase
MHFITGGSFNGKRAWVKKTYMVNEDDHWLSAYDDITLPKELNDDNHDLVILEGIEMWLKRLSEKYDPNQCRDIWNRRLDKWLFWEKNQHNRKLVVIGTDISKGIVPIEKENRLWRDITGWAYQETAAMAEKVDVIWYGLSQTIK